MYLRLINLCRYTIYLLLLVCCKTMAGDATKSSSGAEYAFLSLMALSPDFSAATYSFKGGDSPDTDVTIYRLPYRFELMQRTESLLQLEVMVAYQRADAILQNFPNSGDSIDSQWDTYGAGLGLLYDYNLSKYLVFSPSLRIGITETENRTSFNGSLANAPIPPEFESLINWKAKSSIVNIGLGLGYNWKILDRPSSLKGDVYRSLIKSFDETKPVAEYNEQANLLSIKADMIFPTTFNVYDERLDIVLLLGVNSFFGENRHVLGYSNSYQAGAGLELPLKWKQKKYGYVRFSGQIIRANNLEGWMISLGYNEK